MVTTMRASQKLHRLVIYPKDFQLVFNKSLKTARRMMANMKKDLGKESHHFITIREFCTYFGLTEEELIEKLKLKSDTNPP